MNRIALITLTVAGVACTAVLIAQGSKNRSLARDLEDRRETVAGLKSELRKIAPLTSLEGAGRPVPAVLRSAKAAAIAQSRAATAPAERVEATRKRIDLLVEDLGDMNRNPAGFFKVLPDILRIIQGLSVDEMIEVAAGIDAPGGMNNPDGKAIARMVLFLLAAEHDPMRVIEKSDIMGMRDREIRNALLGQLARRDPAGALEWIKNSDFSRDEKSEFKAMIAVRVLRNNVSEGLKFIRETGSENDGGRGDIREVMMRIPMPPERIPELMTALEDEANADMRSELVGMVLQSTALGGDISEVRKAADQIELTPTELSNFFNRGFSDILMSDPDAAMAWMTEAQDAEWQLRTVPSAIAGWAREDFNAAGEYLGKMEPSRVKDQSIREFAQTITRVDPEAAAAWAMQIGQKPLRDSTVRYVASQWRGKDNERAERWLTENGYDANGQPIGGGEPRE